MKTIPETASFPSGKQFLELLTLPNCKNEHWAETPLGEQSFTPAMQATYCDLVDMVKFQLGDAPMQLSHVLAELVMVALHRRINDMHGQKIEKALGNQHGEPWEMFSDNLHDLAQFVVEFMLKSADDLIAEFIKESASRLAAETSAGGAHHG
jgi:hypothetical protein